MPKKECMALMMMKTVSLVWGEVVDKSELSNAGFGRKRVRTKNCRCSGLHHSILAQCRLVKLIGPKVDASDQNSIYVDLFLISRYWLVPEDSLLCS